MAAKPDFPLLGQLAQDAENARGPARVPEGKGGHVFVDGTLHRILDLNAPVQGQGAFCFSVNEKELTHLCELVDVIYLGFKGLRTTTLAPVQNMPRLRRLNLWWVQKLSDLSPLATLPLDVLSLDDIRHANDLSPLGRMDCLKALLISGGMNSIQKIDTLAPLAAMPALRELQVMATAVTSDGLRPLANCTALQDLLLPSTFETAEYAYLRAKRPDIRCAELAAYQKLSYRLGDKDILVTGKRKPFLSSKKDGKRLQTYRQRFDQMVAEYSREDG